MDQRAAIELGHDLNRHLEVPPRTFHDVGLGNGSDEIAAERNERFPPAIAHSFAGSHRVEATLARGAKAVLFSEAVERDELWLFRDPNRALALDIRMASHRKDAGPGLADVATHEQQIAQHLDSEHPRTVLRQAHAIADDNGLGFAIDARRQFDGGAT